ncbi:hypothetical protein F2N21_04780 [Escherichia coli]|nr:hypothetical protein [Escherichia coli]EFB9660426.1 hypothetical protein [Escherichia coli]EFB9932451.1 hypothetical protein [Escherichia coli]EFE8015788.1 hypothetical protein [Escherichia coli]EFI6137101.1 hypothetical protein [Escherichia coli]
MPTSPVDCHFKTFIAKSDISCLHKTKLAVASSDKRNPRECEDCYCLFFVHLSHFRHHPDRHIRPQLTHIGHIIFTLLVYESE